VVDNLSPEQRSFMMSRVRSKDTRLEVAVRSLAHARGLRFRKHCAWLPGRPDLVFVRSKVAVFIDGDYWHGWRFPAWSERLAPYWQQKIAGNRHRDQLNFRRLRRNGWLVIRLWGHSIESDVSACVDRVEAALRLAQMSPQSNQRNPGRRRLKRNEH
jgi:DNA mismatch endonuclease (patch repair protein)